MRKDPLSLFNIKGKTIILTGSSGFLGTQYAHALSKLDANLIFAVLITGILLPVFMVFVGYSSSYIQTLIFYILCTLLGWSNHIFVKSIIHYRAPINYRGKILSLMDISYNLNNVGPVHLNCAY